MLLKKDNKAITIPKVNSYVVSLTEEDYTKGYVVRYFTQKANDIDSYIYEISRNQFSSLKNSPYYISVSLDWRLTGEPDEIKKSNSASVRIASKTIPKIQLYLPNLLQFHKK
jgi:hypothetical protein